MVRMRTPVNLRQQCLRAGMVGLGMIFDETYRPLFEQLHAEGLYRRDFGLVDVKLAAVASRTGSRAERYRPGCRPRRRLRHFAGADALPQLLAHGVDVVCVATPDDRHFEAARQVLPAGKHVLIEKPSVLRLQELDELDALARRHGVLAKVVYHKLADPDHKKLRTHVVDGVLRHVNNGYCSLLEPKSDQRQPVRRVDHRPQSRHLRRRPLHQADRLHLRRPATAPGWLASTPPASAAWSARPTARPGTRCNCRWSTPIPMAGRRRSTSTPAG